MLNFKTHNLLHQNTTSRGYNLQGKGVDHSGVKPAGFEEDGKNLLFHIWASGKACRNQLILEGRMQGFSGLSIMDYKGHPFPGSENEVYAPPLSIKYFCMFDLYWNGFQGNVIQHGGGEGVYLWRETLVGFEFMMFDYGPGALDQAGSSQADISSIFDSGRSFRKGGPGQDGEIHGGGLGLGMTYVACNSYLTRIVSMNNGWVRVVDKEPGLRESVFDKTPFNTLQVDLKFAQGDIRASGFLAQGFVPVVPVLYEGSFTPVSEGHVIGSIRNRRFKPVKRGSWQTEPAEGLKRLKPGDEVAFTYFDPKIEKREFSRETYLVTVPNSRSPMFKIGGETEVNANDVKLISAARGTRTTWDGFDVLRAINEFGLRAGDKIKITYQEDVVVDRRFEHRGRLKEIPSDENQGTFIFEDGITLGYNRVKEFTLHN